MTLHITVYIICEILNHFVFCFKYVLVFLLKKAKFVNKISRYRRPRLFTAVFVHIREKHNKCAFKHR